MKRRTRPQVPGRKFFFKSVSTALRFCIKIFSSTPVKTFNSSLGLKMDHTWWLLFTYGCRSLQLLQSQDQLHWSWNSLQGTSIDLWYFCTRLVSIFTVYGINIEYIRLSSFLTALYSTIASFSFFGLCRSLYFFSYVQIVERGVITMLLDGIWCFLLRVNCGGVSLIFY